MHNLSPFHASSDLKTRADFSTILGPYNTSTNGSLIDDILINFGWPKWPDLNQVNCYQVYSTRYTIRINHYGVLILFQVYQRNLDNVSCCVHRTIVAIAKWATQSSEAAFPSRISLVPWFNIFVVCKIYTQFWRKRLRCEKRHSLFIFCF